MRDLANQTFSTSANKTSSKIQISRMQLRIIGAVVVILVVLIGVKYFLSGGSPLGDSSVALRDAPGGLTPVGVSNSNAAAGGVNLTSQSTTLRVVKSDISGSATATRTFGDGTYSLTVSATLPNPHANSYAVFLVGSDGPVLTDFMSGSGTSWTLSFNDKDKFSKFNEIWITEKITKESKSPETHIMAGSF